MTRLFKIFLRNQALGSASVRQIAFHSFLSVTVCLGAFAQNQDTTPAPKPPIQQEAPPPEAPKPAPHKPDAEPPKPQKRTLQIKVTGNGEPVRAAQITIENEGDSFTDQNGKCELKLYFKKLTIVVLKEGWATWKDTVDFKQDEQMVIAALKK